MSKGELSTRRIDGMQSRSISTEWANHNNVACCHWWWCDGRKKSQHLNADYYDVLWWRVFGSSCYYVYPPCIIMIMAWNVFRGLTWPWLDNNGCDAALHMTLLPLIIRRRVLQPSDDNIDTNVKCVPGSIHNHVQEQNPSVKHGRGMSVSWSADSNAWVFCDADDAIKFRIWSSS